jgi:hypothetical protein
MRKAYDRAPFQLAKSPGTAQSPQVLGETLFHTPVKDKLAYNKLENVRVVDVGTGFETAVKVFRGLPASLARDLRSQEKKYLAGEVYLQTLWKKFFDAIPEMAEARKARRMNTKAKIALDMAPEVS